MIVITVKKTIGSANEYKEICKLLLTMGELLAERSFCPVLVNMLLLAVLLYCADIGLALFTLEAPSFFDVVC